RAFFHNEVHFAALGQRLTQDEWHRGRCRGGQQRYPLSLDVGGGDTGHAQSTLLPCAIKRAQLIPNLESQDMYDIVRYSGWQRDGSLVQHTRRNTNAVHGHPLSQTCETYSESLVRWIARVTQPSSSSRAWTLSPALWTAIRIVASCEARRPERMIVPPGARYRVKGWSISTRGPK